VPRYTVGHICGHPFAHVADYRDQPREMQDLRRWHDWMHSQPCLSCSRPAGLIIAKARRGNKWCIWFPTLKAVCPVHSSEPHPLLSYGGNWVMTR
jgi:hypothetical protein